MYLFDIASEHSRILGDVRQRWLTSSAIVTLFSLSSVGLLGLLFAGYLLRMPPTLWMGGMLLLGSWTGALLLLHTFGTTYYAHLKPSQTVQTLTQTTDAEALVNVATATTKETLARLSRYTTGGIVPLNDIIAVLAQDSYVAALLHRFEIEASELSDALARALPGYTWEQWAEGTLHVAATFNDAAIEAVHMITALLVQPGVKTFLRQHEYSTEDIMFAAWWTIVETAAAQQRARWWTKENLLDFTGVGLSWTSGYTPLVDQFSRFPRGNLWDQIIVGRERYVERLITTLARQRQSNVLLVGAAGTGRLGVVLEMARRVFQNKAHPQLQGQRVVYIHIGQLLAQQASNASQLAFVSRALAEMERAGNIIAVIDGLGAILGEEGEARVNMSDILLPFFSSLAVRVVVIMSAEEYNLRLRAHEEIAHFFEVVQIESASNEETLQTLALATPQLERTTGVTLPYKTLRTLVQGTDSILQHIPYPERAFDFLEEALSVAGSRHAHVLRPEDVEELISQKVGVSVGKIRDQERSKLLGLEELMHQRLVNQHQAVAAVARAMIRARAGVRSQTRPIGTFLFLGPTGVGKTETGKTLAEAYFGSEEALIRLDMSEFQAAESVATLIGDHHQPIGRLTALIDAHPFTVLLLDEFEKAHSNIHQLFLQVFDEGRLTDARGQTVSFAHAIIIATSNAGAELIREEVKDGQVPDNFSDTLRDHILQQGIFRPELINRFDGVITFTPLTRAHIEEVARRMLKKLNKRLDSTHGVTVVPTEELITYLVGLGYNPEFGARPMARVLQDTVEYAVAQRVIQGVLEPGQEVVLSPRILEQLRTSAAANGN